MQPKPHNRIGAAVALVLCAGCTAPFGLEYESTFLAGRVHNPTPDVVYQTGDTNGNGLIDENEQPAPPRIEQESGSATLVSSPRSNSSTITPLGSVFVPFEPGVSRSGSLTLMSGFLDTRNGDGIADGDGFVSATDPDVDFLGGPSNDLDDLVRLPTGPDSIFVGSWAQSQDFELLHVHRFKGVTLKRSKYEKAVLRDRTSQEETTEKLTEDQTKGQRTDTYVEFGYGARFHRRDDFIRFLVNGGPMGAAQGNMVVDNQAIGPVIAANVGIERDGWTITAGGSLVAAYNDGDGDQATAIGEDLVPGQHNHPLFFGPTYSRTADSEQNFTVISEFSTAARYRIRPGLTAGVSYNAFFLSAVRHTENQIDFSQPALGFIDGGTDDLFLQTALASVEYRR